MPELFLIRKGGYYYRPNARGYTASVHEAGRFPKEEAFAHMDACAPGEIVIFPAPTISVSIAVEDDIRVTAEKIVLEHVASGSLNMDNLAGAIAGALEEERAKASTPTPDKHVVAEDPALIGIAETIKESGGHWKPCSGCYDTEDGHPTQRYPFSKALVCDVGCGCHECGGLGAVWEHWTEEDVAEFQRISDEVDREHRLEVRITRLETALRRISSPSQTTDLLWWQIEARAALATTEGQDNG